MKRAGGHIRRKVIECDWLTHKDIDKNSSGTTLLSATTVPSEILNSTAIAAAAADATTKADAAQTAATAASTSALTGKLDKSGAQTMTGPVSFNTPGAIVVGILNAAGTTDNGLYLGDAGLVGRKAGDNTFSISTDGTAVFKGELEAAYGSFTGSVSTGASPALSGTTMTGTGAKIYGNGSFAFGNSSKNIVFDNSNIYVNGLLNATTGSGGGMTVPDTRLSEAPATILTFTVTKEVPLILHVEGTAQASYEPHAFTANNANINLSFLVYSSDGQQTQYSYISSWGATLYRFVSLNVSFSVAALYSSGYLYSAYYVNPSWSVSGIFTLPPGTYTLRMVGFSSFYSGGSAAAPSSSFATSYAVYVYQASL